MDEAHRPAYFENPGGGEFVGRGRGGAGVQPGEASGEPKVRLAQHGRRPGQLASWGGEATQPLHDRVRDGARRQARDTGRGRRRRLDSLADYGTDQFAEEERNPAGHLVARGREGLLHFGAER